MLGVQLSQLVISVVIPSPPDDSGFLVGSMFAMIYFGKTDYFVFLIIFLINSKHYYMFGLISLVFRQFSYWFQFGFG